LLTSKTIKTNSKFHNFAKNNNMNLEDIKILIVDDEPDILEFVEFNLQNEGIQTRTAENGKIAIEVAKDFLPHLILMDIMMPEMDGIDACRAIRKVKELEKTMIVFLTARDEDFMQITSFEAGADDFISKPIKPKVLISKIKSLLRRLDKNEENQPETLTFGNLTINKERVMVNIDDRMVVLPRKEFELLYLLATKPSKVFSREEIFAKVWGSDVIVGQRTIDVHVRKIREKIGVDVIHTVKGLGYKFEY
jgi:two-component system, OmpR family, alkaline phosphatase synthesis response regulator PhoP